MKMKKLLLVGILMLAIFTLGAVSAADDANMTAGEGGLETIEETPLAEDEYITVEIEPLDEIQYGKYNSLEISVAENVTGYVKYYVDEEEDYGGPEYISDEYPIYTGFDINEFGPHTLYVNYFDGNRPDKNFEFPFTVNDYYLSVYPMDEDELRYGGNSWFGFSIPYSAHGTLDILVNGHEYNFRYNEEFGWPDSDFTIKKEDILYGENTIKATFTPYEKTSQFKAKTIEKTYNFTSSIQAPYEVSYNTDANVTLTLPEDAEGTLTVTFDEDTYTSEISNGKATVAIPKLKVGHHEIFAKFEGNYAIENLDEYLIVVPNVITPPYLWDKGEQKITVEMSDDIAGNITATLDGDEIANVEIKNGIAVIPLDLPIGYHYIYLDYIGDSYISLNNVGIEVIDENPSWEMKVRDVDILKTHAYLTFETMPAYIMDEGTFELTIDGKKVRCTGAVFDRLFFDAAGMDAGQHEYALAFKGDGYYLPTSASGKFNMTGMIIEAPETYVYGTAEDDSHWIRVYMTNETAGTLTVNINGKEIHSQETTPEDDYAYEGFCLDELDLKYNEINEIEIKFESPKYGTITKTANIYATYALMTDSEVRYGGNQLRIRAPQGLDASKLSVKIDGVDYEVLSEEEYLYVMTAEDLSIGYHNATLTYKGDKTYPANTNTSQFKVYASVEIRNNVVSLILPDDAKGNLTVTVDDKEYANVKASGKAEVDLNALPWGNYYVTATYTGDDYVVLDDSRSVTVNPEFKIPQKMIVGDDETLSIDLAGINGTLEAYIDDSRFVSENLVDGRASISLKDLTAGKHTIAVGFKHFYYDKEGYYYEDYYTDEFEIEVINPITAKDASVLYSASGTYTAQIKDVNGNAVTSGKVTFYVLDGKKQILKKTVNIKNGAAKLTYKITTAPKVYTIKTVYNKATVTKKLTVKSIVTLKAVTVKKSAKKLTLQATLKKVNGKYLKGKKITFKFNGKKYTAKTNSKGIAKVTIKSSVLKKLKVGKKITYQATYLKDTVKKTAKVKK